MVFIDNVEKKEYEEFVKNHPKSHFMQSYYWGEVMKGKNFSPYYVGLKENNQLIATALLLKKHLIGKYCYFYSPRGFIMDYSDKKVIKLFTDKIKSFARKNHGIFVKIDPDIKLHDLDSDGNILGNDNSSLVDFLKKLGYKHKGFNVDFVNEQPRFTFRLNIDKDFEMIYSNIHPTTRKILNKGNQYNLNLYIGDDKDIPKFYETMKDTAIRERLHLTPIEYYQNFYSTLNKHNMSDLYVVEVKIKDLIKTYEKNKNDLEKEIEEIDIKYKNKDKAINVKNDLNKKLEKTIKEIDLIKSIEKDKIILSSIITVKYGNKVWTIHGGNSNILRELNSNYLLYYQIIQDAYKEGYKIVDFFGTSGIANPDKSDPIFGIHSFKKRFGGEYTEFIGEFDLITNKFMYFLYKNLIPIYRKIKRSK